MSTLGARPDEAAVLARQSDAVRLRASGLSYRRIADRLGYASASGAHRAVVSLLRENAAETADQMRNLINARLDTMTASLMPAVLKGDPASVNAAVRVEARRAALNGLDAPARVEVRSALVNEIANGLEALRELVVEKPRPYELPAGLGEPLD